MNLDSNLNSTKVDHLLQLLSHQMTCNTNYTPAANKLTTGIIARVKLEF